MYSRSGAAPCTFPLRTRSTSSAKARQLPDTGGAVPSDEGLEGASGLRVQAPANKISSTKRLTIRPISQKYGWPTIWVAP
jgi:hypothetical protein